MSLESAATILDLVVKTVIGAAVTLGLFVGKELYNDVRQNKELGAARAAKIAVLESETASTKTQLQRIESKLDRIWEVMR